MSDPQDPESKFGFSDRAPASAGRLKDDEPTGERAKMSDDTGPAARDSIAGTVDGDDLDIEELPGLRPQDPPDLPEAGDSSTELALDGTDEEGRSSRDPSDTDDEQPAATVALEVPPSEEPSEESGPLPATMMLDMPAVSDTEESDISDVSVGMVPSGTLEVVDGPDTGKVFEVLEPLLVVGRGLDSDVVINDSSVSRKHFRLERSEIGYRLVDLGSGNGSIVNGAQVQEIELSEGARIEAGTTHLVWRDAGSIPVGADALDRKEETTEDGDRTRVGELAAVEVDPAWSAERSMAAQPGAPKSPKPGKGPTHTEPMVDDADPLDTDDVRTIAWAAVAVVFLVLAFVLIDRAAGLGILAPPAGSESGISEEAGELLSQGMEAFRERRWYDAKGHFRDALTAAPEFDEAKTAMALVEVELRAWRAVEDADKHLDADDHGEAIETLSGVPDTSTYYPEAQGLLRDARDEAVDAALEKARALVAEGKSPEAIDTLNAVLALAPGDTDVLAMEQELQMSLIPEPQDAATGGANRPTRRSPRRGSSGKRKRREKGTTLKPDRRASMGPSALNTGPGLSLYAAGNFAGAIDYFDGQAQRLSSKRDRSQAQRLATAITRFDTFWRTGRQKVSSGKVDDAISALKQARKVDQTISGAFQSRVKRLLARQYAWKSERELDKGNYPMAGKLARSALGLDPTDRSAQRVQKQVQAKAERWLKEARSMAASNPDKAMDLLSRVLTVFPRSDARYQSAYRLLNQLGQDEDE